MVLAAMTLEGVRIFHTRMVGGSSSRQCTVHQREAKLTVEVEMCVEHARSEQKGG